MQTGEPKWQSGKTEDLSFVPPSHTLSIYRLVKIFSSGISWEKIEGRISEILILKIK